MVADAAKMSNIATATTLQAQRHVAALQDILVKHRKYPEQGRLLGPICE